MNKKNTEEIARDVLRIRLSQMIVNEDYKAGKFKIPIHLAFGHEAIATAVKHIMKDGDKLILTHRNIAYNLAMQGSLKPILNEYRLEQTGVMNGKTGSMNLINPKRGIIYSSSILGNNFSVAVGVAYAQKIRNTGITIVLGGDGSIEEGSFHESLLLFKSLKLPSLIIIENNEWSMSTRISERRCDIDLAKFTESFKIRYEVFDGRNVCELIDRLQKIKEYSIDENEPVCIEINISTLGDWVMETPEFPKGKFINYHAGPAPTIDIKTCPIIIKNTNQDPVYILSEFLGKETFEKISKEVRIEMEKEMK